MNRTDSARRRLESVQTALKAAGAPVLTPDPKTLTEQEANDYSAMEHRRLAHLVKLVSESGVA